MNKTLAIGHRGARGYLAENTLPSFDYAIELGCDWVELDVYHVDGELLVIHDTSVDRTTNGTGLVAELSFAHIRSLNAGDCHPVPTLQEVISLVDRRCKINIELKGPDTARPVSDLLNQYCNAQWTPEDFLISSFDHTELELANPIYPRGILFAKCTPNMWETPDRLRAWSVNFEKSEVNRSLVEDAHCRGYKLLVYTVNVRDEIIDMIDCGVDGIFSDYPDRIVNLRQSYCA